MSYSYDDLRFAEYDVMTYVKKYPCLYYKGHPDHFRREVTTPIWTEISKKIYENKVVETGHECEQLWNNMWALFMKYRRRLRETAGQGKMIRFRWSSEMKEFDELIEKERKRLELVAGKDQKAKSTPNTESNKQSQIVKTANTDPQSQNKQSGANAQRIMSPAKLSFASTPGPTHVQNTNGTKIMKLTSQADPATVGGSQTTGKEPKVALVGSHISPAQSSASSSADTLLSKPDIPLPASKSHTPSTNSQAEPFTSDHADSVRKGQKRSAEELRSIDNDPSALVQVYDSSLPSLLNEENDYYAGIGPLLATKLRIIHKFDKFIACEAEFEVQKVLYMAEIKAISAWESRKNSSHPSELSSSSNTL